MNGNPYIKHKPVEVVFLTEWMGNPAGSVLKLWDYVVFSRDGLYSRGVVDLVNPEDAITYGLQPGSPEGKVESTEEAPNSSRKDEGEDSADVQATTDQHQASFKRRKL